MAQNADFKALHQQQTSFVEEPAVVAVTQKMNHLTKGQGEGHVDKRFADAERRQGGLWGCVTFPACTTLYSQGAKQLCVGFSCQQNCPPMQAVLQKT